jgi:hypothetical protein
LVGFTLSKVAPPSASTSFPSMSMRGSPTVSF